MKYFIISVGLSLALGIGCAILLIFFIEGWGTFVTIFAVLASFGFAGYIMGKTRPKSSIYAGIFISLPFIIGMGSSADNFHLMLEFASAPSKIDSRNFYVLLTPLSIMAAYLGILFGKSFIERKI